MSITKQTMTWKQRFLNYGIAGLVVLVVTGFSRFGYADFKKVSRVSFVTSPSSTVTENMISDTVSPQGFSGEYGVKMTGKVHDGYLELHIDRESKTEIQIIPMARVYNLVFVEPK